MQAAENAVSPAASIAPDHARQHIPRARRGQFGIAAGVDVRRLPRRGNDAARAFEDDDTAKTIRQRLRRNQAVGLHLRR